ncbi:hypothetical protein Anas_10207 [Armadillidium nasatum]|uniref:Uncharacterized protein n=1 Tax=Armadillidium nasatum TaxID=96803 RepID=A0A5N5T5I9_9CRUS|nr:hypothetical protein Anas_10207 [Armadillidium nasatum]
MASLGEKRTPMAWQHRDMNYHHAAYQERYGQGYEMNGIRTGPPSTSDRLSHRTDKSWHTQRDSQAAYPPSRPSYSTGRPPSQPHSAVTSSNTSTSSSESDTENEDPRGPMQLPPFPPQPIYGGGYEGYYPGYPPSVSHYPGTLKSAKSVPAIGTWDGEPCPIHGIGPMSLPGPHPPPIMMPPHAAFTLPPKKANSIYDMRILAAHPPPPASVGAIYGTLPVRPPGIDRRSLVGAPAGIPPQLLPPMARPRPIVLSEGGTAEPLPVRSPPDKTSTLPLDVASKMTDTNKDEKHKEKCRGGLCVGMIVMGVICTGLLLGILLVFIL